MTKLMSREHAKDVATQLSRKRLEAGGGIAKGARQVAGEHGSRAADGPRLHSVARPTASATQ